MYIHNKITGETRMKFLDFIQDSNIKKRALLKSVLKNRNVLKSKTTNSI